MIWTRRAAAVLAARPVAACLLWAVVAGGAAWSARGIARPDPDRAIGSRRIVVLARWPGADAARVERELTAPVERTMRGVLGGRSTQSVSQSDGVTGTMRVQMLLSSDAREPLVRVEVAERLRLLRSRLPSEVLGPTMAPVGPRPTDVDASAVVVSVGGRAPLAMRAQVARDLVMPRLQAVDGVSTVTAVGAPEPAALVLVDAGAHAALQADQASVNAAISRNEEQRAAGLASQDGGLLPVTVTREGVSAEALERLPVTLSGNTQAHLRQIASVSDASLPPPTMARVRGEDVVLINVARRAITDPASVARAIDATLERVRPLLPTGVTLAVDYRERDDERALRAQLLSAGAAGVVLVLMAAFAMHRTARPFLAVVAAAATSLEFAVIFMARLKLVLTPAAASGLLIGVILCTMVGSAAVLDRARKRDGGRGRRHMPELARDIWRPLLAAVAIMGAAIAAVVALVPGGGAAREVAVPAGFVLAAAYLCSPLVLLIVLGERGLAEHDLSGLAPLAGAVSRWRWPAWLTLALGCAAAAVAVANWQFEGIAPPDDALSVNVHVSDGDATGELRRVCERIERTMVRAAPAISLRTLMGRSYATIVVEGHDLDVDAQDAAARAVGDITADFGAAEVSVVNGPADLEGRSVAPRMRVLLRGYELAGMERLEEQLRSTLARLPRVRFDDWDSRDEDRRGREVVVAARDERLAAVGLTRPELVTSLREALRPALADAPRLVGDRSVLVRDHGAGAVSAASLPAVEIMLPGRRQSSTLAGVATITRSARPNVIKRSDRRYQRAVTFEYHGDSHEADSVVDAAIGRLSLPPGFAVAREQATFGTGGGTSPSWRVGAVGVVLLLVYAALVGDLRVAVEWLAATAITAAVLLAVLLLLRHSVGPGHLAGGLLAAPVTIWLATLWRRPRLATAPIAGTRRVWGLVALAVLACAPFGYLDRMSFALGADVTRAFAVGLVCALGVSFGLAATMQTVHREAATALR